MKKALKTGIAVAAAAALFAGYAAVDLQFQPEACPVAEVYETAVLKQGSRGGEVKEVQTTRAAATTRARTSTCWQNASMPRHAAKATPVRWLWAPWY